MRFRAVIQLNGKTATGIQIPAEVIASLGSHKRPPVRITIGSYTYRTTVAVMGGAFMVPLSAEHRTGAGVAAGDEVDVDIDLDTEPREVALPQDFADALNSDANARQFFDGLSFSHKREYVAWIEEAKRAATRQERIAKAVNMLRESRTRG